MKNKIFGFICILVMTALMAACGSDAVYPVSKMDSGTQTSESILEYEDTEDSDAAQTSEGRLQTEAAGESIAAGSEGETYAETYADRNMQEYNSTTDDGQLITGSLYIGMAGNFDTYPYTGEVTPENLVLAISKLTGWDLTLAQAIESDKNSITVTFSKKCALYSGPPSPQKEEFFVYDIAQLAQTILDSIQMTFQQNFVDVMAGENPDSLKVYYKDEDDAPIYLEVIDKTVPLDEPYSWYTQDD